MKVSREKLNKIIQEELQEMAQEGEVDEALGGFLKGAASALGSKMAGAGRAVGGTVGGKLAGAGRAVGGAVSKAGQAVAKQVGDIAQAGKEMSVKQNIANAEKKVNTLRAQLQAAEEELLNLQANAEE